MGEGPNERGSSRGHIMDSVEGSLERLQTDHIDLYQLHGTDTVTPIDETLRALDDLVASGKVRYVGVSNWQAWRIAKALGICRAQGLCPLRDHPVLLFDRRPRPRARDRAAASTRKSSA